MLAKPVLFALSALLLASCATQNKDMTAETSTAAKKYYAETLTAGTRDADRLKYLEGLPARKKPIRVAVYEIPDQTGKNRPNENYADYSRAVTQGAEALVIQALTDAGKGHWFDVVERRFVERVLNERTLVERSYLDAQQRRFTARQDAQQDRFEQALRAKQREVDLLEDDYRRNDMARTTAVSAAKGKMATLNRAIEEAQQKGDNARLQQITAEQRLFVLRITVGVFDRHGQGTGFQQSVGPGLGLAFRAVQHQLSHAGPQARAASLCSR